MSPLTSLNGTKYSAWLYLYSVYRQNKNNATFWEICSYGSLSNAYITICHCCTRTLWCKLALLTLSVVLVYYTDANAGVGSVLLLSLQVSQQHKEVKI